MAGYLAARKRGFMTHIPRGYVPLSTAAPELNLGATALEVLRLRLEIGMTSKEPSVLTLLGLRHLLLGLGDTAMSHAQLAALEQWVDDQFREVLLST